LHKHYRYCTVLNDSFTLGNSCILESAPKLSGMGGVISGLTTLLVCFFLPDAPDLCASVRVPAVMNELECQLEGLQFECCQAYNDVVVQTECSEATAACTSSVDLFLARLPQGQGFLAQAVAKTTSSGRRLGSEVMMKEKHAFVGERRARLLQQNMIGELLEGVNLVARHGKCRWCYKFLTVCHRSKSRYFQRDVFPTSLEIMPRNPKLYNGAHHAATD